MGEVADAFKAVTGKPEFEDVNPEDIPEQFKNPALISLIHTEISKDHLCDDAEKLTAFLFGLTSHSPNPSDRKSPAIIGDSSVGKDNLMNSVLKHFPNVLNLTNATTAVLEDDTEQYDIIKFSEINVSKEGGANAHLTETIKQYTEGGIDSLKKDQRTGFKTTRHSQQAQKSVFYSTTEEKRDHELETRYAIIPVSHNSLKVKAVNEHTLKTAADPESLIREGVEADSWIKQGLQTLPRYNVLVPFAPLLSSIFDNTNPRSQRDLKRLMALVRAHTRLYQLQRPKINYKCQEIIVALPVDLINVLKISSQFFNVSYSGLEPRLQGILDLIDELGRNNEGLARRKDIQDRLGISKNTIKARLDILRDKGYVEATRNKEDPNWYYKRGGQMGVKWVSTGVNFQHIKNLLSKFSFKQSDHLSHLSDTLLTSCFEAEIEDKLLGGVKIPESADTPTGDMIKVVEDSVFDEFDTPPLTPHPIIDTIRRLDSGKGIHIDLILQEAQNTGRTPADVDSQLDKLKNAGDIVLIAPNTFKVMS